MNVLDSIRLLYCLNEDGLDKAHAFLGKLVDNPEYIQKSYGELMEELKEISRDQKERYKKEEAKKEQLKEQYKEEFKMIGRSSEFHKDSDILHAINFKYDTGFMRQISSYNWGYIQGKRAERARRKKVAV